MSDDADRPSSSSYVSRVAIGDGLARLEGGPVEVRCSEGAQTRASIAADLVRDALDFLSPLCAGARPDVALVVAGERDWTSRQPYGLPYFNDDAGQIRPGVLVMSAGPGAYWREMTEAIRDASPRGFERLRATYPDGSGGVDLQPFFDLVVVHELGHAFGVLGGLRLPTDWLGEVFANVALYSYVAARAPGSLETLSPPHGRCGEPASRRSCTGRGLQHAGRVRGPLHRW